MGFRSKQRARRSGGPSTFARLGTATVGIALLAGGALAVFVTTNSVGASALVAAGTVLVALALLADQLQSVEGGGFKLQLYEIAAKLQEASEADAIGDTDAAEELRRDAQELLTVMQPLAEKYEELRELRPAGRSRTEAMGTLVRQAQEMANLDSVSQDTVEELFRSAHDGNRVMALGIMRGQPRLASVSIAAAAVRRPRSSYEQFQALRICLDAIERGAGSEERKMIGDAIAVARDNKSLVTPSHDRSRDNLANRILERIENAK